jgi:hypothetical protein
MRPFSRLGLLLALAVAGCGAASDEVSSSLDPNLGMPGGPAGGVAPIDAGTGLSSTPPANAGATPGGNGNTTVIYSDSGALDDPDKCVTTKAAAPPASNPKVDIVWVVDTSQSMFDEQKRINQNMVQFANAITTANIDVSIVMVSQAPSLTGEVGIPLPGICADLPPDPLAGTPLESDPRYHFVQTYVDSKEPLNVALSAYPRYSSFLRAGSTVHFIMVSDDDAQYAGGTPDGRAAQFQTDMSTRLGRPFRLHTISSPGPTPCSASSCDFDPSLGIACVWIGLQCAANASGLTYYALAQRTMGLTASICESDWSSIFRAFGDNIIKSAPLPCDYTIPPPPSGEQLDPQKVNVAFTPAGGAEEIFPRVDPAACGTNAAWHYDNPAAPTKVLLCPAACTEAAAGGSMNIAFGCDTVVLL